MQRVKRLKFFAYSTLFVFAMIFSGAGLARASVDVTGSNDLTGPNSDNTNDWSIDQNMNVVVDNTASANQDFDLEVATSPGSVGSNTEVGDLRSGDIWGDFVVSNDLNNADFALTDMMAMDPGSFDITLANDTTGPNSRNENEVNIDANQRVDLRNTARISNDLDVEAQTGGGTIHNNTVVGDIRTGSIRVEGDVTNTANQNTGMLDLSGLGGTSVTTDFSNFLTGPQSVNENELRAESNLDLRVNNTATIDNSLDVEASTGGNTVSNNTVVGDIQTGSVLVQFSANNTAN